jgi:membrane associated rhomboid family serine protease
MLPFGPSNTPRAVKTLLIANLAIFVLEILPYVGRYVLGLGALVPDPTFIGGQIWRLVTYMFLHAPGSPFHILFNMLVLWMFGVEMETMWGTKRFTIFYFICGIGSGMFSLFSLLDPRMAMTPVIGASGAVLGVITIYAYYFPHRQILLFFILPINIRIFVIGYAIFSLLGSFGGGGGISHLTHLGGIAIAFLYIKLYPLVDSWWTDFRRRRSEQKMRMRAESEIQRKRFFEEQVDPILAKIGREGMESLTKKEKKILQEAAHSDKERLKKRGITPMDLFR